MRESTNDPHKIHKQLDESPKRVAKELTDYLEKNREDYRKNQERNQRQLEPNPGNKSTLTLRNNRERIQK